MLDQNGFSFSCNIAPYKNHAQVVHCNCYFKRFVQFVRLQAQEFSTRMHVRVLFERDSPGYYLCKCLETLANLMKGKKVSRFLVYPLYS